MKNPFSNLFKKNKKGADAIAPDTGAKPKKKGFLENFFKNRMGKKAAQGEDVVGVELTPEEIRLAQLTSNKSNQWVLEKFFVHKVEGMPDGGTVLDNPDLMFVFTPASFREGVVGLLDKHPGMTCGVWQERPESTGYVNASSADPFIAPVIQPNYLAEETDRRILLAGMRLGRKLMRTSMLENFFDKEVAPGDQVQTDDEFLDFAFQNGTTAYHLIGTAQMGPQSNPMSVVNAELKVYGIRNLRVVDASIMPTMPSANTNAATLMIAEKAADSEDGRCGANDKREEVKRWDGILR